MIKAYTMQLNKRKIVFFYAGIALISVSFNNFRTNKSNYSHYNNPTKNNNTTLATYHNEKLVYVNEEVITAAPGTKSVIFNQNGSKLYAMNLEGMSVSVFNRLTRQKELEYKFKPTKALGWDYTLHKAIPSFEEKPVEACFSHNDKLLWVSLHNANGIVPFNFNNELHHQKTATDKKIYVKQQGVVIDSIYLPLITTGKTPKVIATTATNHLLVSNWHSYNVSVLAINDTAYPYAKKIATIPVAAIPRGIAVDNEEQKSYIAIMGGNTITVVNNKTWQKEKDIEVASTPRHLVLDKKHRLFVSYNSLGKIACINTATGKTVFSAKTNAQPRTITLNKTNQYLFVTCYSSNMVDVFKVTDTGFHKIYALECKGKPVGVDVFEDDKMIEAWVCNYVNGNIKIFTFKKEDVK